MTLSRRTWNAELLDTSGAMTAVCPFPFEQGRVCFRPHFLAPDAQSLRIMSLRQRLPIYLCNAENL